MSLSTAEMDRNFETPPREEIINTAVKFLQNPNVINTALAAKQKFLKDKGLTDEEIRLACEKSGSYFRHDAQISVPPALPPPHNYTGRYGSQGYVQISVFDRIREAIHNVALISFISFAIYKFYEKFIKPYLFGIKKKSVEDSVNDLSKNVSKSINELKEGLMSVKIEMDKINQGTENSTQRQLEVLQNDISSVKGLLLSRKQFPSVSSNPVVPPSIPAWQLSSVQTEPDSDQKGEEYLEIGSASGSSDPEHATKTSDSSLEIINSVN